MNESISLEIQLAGWSKSTSKAPPKVTFFLQSDEDVEFFEAHTTAKGKVAGQIYDIAIALSEQDDQSHMVLKPVGGPLSKQAAMFCENENFKKYCYDIHGGIDPKFAIYNVCKIESRAELDHNASAAKQWEAMQKLYSVWTGEERP